MEHEGTADQGTEYQPGGTVTRLASNTLRAFTQTEWAMLAIGSILCGYACIWIAGAMGIPSQPHFDGSLIAGGTPAVGLIAVIFCVAISVLIGSVMAGFVEREAGLFCCCLGLAALGVRCGPMRPVLQYAGGPSVFFSLAIEVALLGLMLVVGWLGSQLILKKVPGITRAGLVSPSEEDDAALPQKIGTLGVQILVTAIIELILVQSDAKPQAMTGLFIAAYLGSLAAYNFAPLPNAIWYWVGPSLVGFAGYVLAHSGADGVAIGDLSGWNAPLARATPLDYAGMGTAGALLGYWAARRWSLPEEEALEDTVVEAQ